MRGHGVYGRLTLLLRLLLLLTAECWPVTHGSAAAHQCRQRHFCGAFLVGTGAAAAGWQQQQEQQQQQHRWRNLSSIASYCSRNTRSCMHTSISSSNTASSNCSSRVPLRDADFLRRVSKWILLQAALGINPYPTTEQLLLQQQLQQQQEQQQQEQQSLGISSISNLQHRYATLLPGVSTAAAAAAAIAATEAPAAAEAPGGSAAGIAVVEQQAACGRISSIRNGGAFFDLSPLNNPYGPLKLQVYAGPPPRLPLVPGCLYSSGTSSQFPPRAPPSSGGPCLGAPRLEEAERDLSCLSVHGLLPLLDVGDVVLVRGPIRKALRGEVTLDISGRGVGPQGPVEVTLQGGAQRGGHLLLLAKQLLPPDALGDPQNSAAAAAVAAARMHLLQHLADKGPWTVYAAALQQQQQQQQRETSRNPWLPQLLLLQRHLGQLQQLLQRSPSAPPPQQQQQQQQRGADEKQQQQHQQRGADEKEQQQQQQREADEEQQQQEQQDAYGGLRNVALLLQQPQRRRVLLLRTAAIEAIRSLLAAEGYLAVDTPCLLRLQQQQQQQQQEGTHAVPSGAAPVRLFESQLNATKARVVLRQAPELNLKKLIISGVSDKVYELGRCFRNEGISWRHHFEYLSLEVYATLKTAADMRQLTEQVVAAAAAAAAAHALAAAAAGNTTPQGLQHAGRREGGFSVSPSVFSFQAPFKKIFFFDAIKKYTKIPMQQLTHKEALRQTELLLKQQDEQQQQLLPAACFLSKEHLAGFLFKKFVEKKLLEPTHVLHPPLLLSPLAAPAAATPPTAATTAAPAAAIPAAAVPLAERFETYIGGVEIADGYAELACPFEQRRRFEKQLQLSNRGDADATLPDQEFVDCLTLGLPPTAGLGIGIDRLVQLLSGVPSIRHAMFLPTTG